MEFPSSRCPLVPLRLNKKQCGEAARNKTQSREWLLTWKGRMCLFPPNWLWKITHQCITAICLRAISLDSLQAGPCNFFLFFLATPRHHHIRKSLYLSMLQQTDNAMACGFLTVHASNHRHSTSGGSRTSCSIKLDHCSG